MPTETTPPVAAEPNATPPASNDALPVTADLLTGPLIAGMPEKATATNDEKPLPDPGTALLPGFEIKDDHGTVFNPSEHAADEKGVPKKNKAGRFYSKFIGRAGSARKAGVDQIKSLIREPEANAGNDSIPAFEGVGETPPMSAETVSPDPSDGMALMLIPTIDGVMQSLLGGDVALSKQDKEVLTPVTAAYLRSKGAKDIPPGLALTMVAVAVYAPKFQKPSVKERITLIVLKIKNFFARK